MSAQAERKDARSGNAKPIPGNEVRPSSAKPEPSGAQRDPKARTVARSARPRPETPRGCGGGGRARRRCTIISKKWTKKPAICPSRHAMDRFSFSHVTTGRLGVASGISCAVARSKREGFLPRGQIRREFVPKCEKSAGISFATQDRAIEVRTQERKRRRRSRERRARENKRETEAHRAKKRKRGERNRTARERRGSAGTGRARERRSRAKGARAERGVRGAGCASGSRKRKTVESGSRGAPARRAEGAPARRVDRRVRKRDPAQQKTPVARTEAPATGALRSKARSTARKARR